MIVANLKNCHEIENLDPRFKMLFDYIGSHDLLHAPLGRIELDGDKFYINNAQEEGVPRESQRLEFHRRYIDVHILLEGEETIGWKDIANLEQVCVSYDTERDCAFSSDRPTSYTDMRIGEFMILYPSDMHAPIIGRGEIRKIVAKIAVR